MIGLKAYALQSAIELAEYDLKGMATAEDVLSVAKAMYDFLREGETSDTANVIQLIPKGVN